LSQFEGTFTNVCLNSVLPRLMQKCGDKIDLLFIDEIGLLFKGIIEKKILHQLK